MVYPVIFDLIDVNFLSRRHDIWKGFSVTILKYFCFTGFQNSCKLIFFYLHLSNQISNITLKLSSQNKFRKNILKKRSVIVKNRNRKKKGLFTKQIITNFFSFNSSPALSNFLAWYIKISKSIENLRKFYFVWSLKLCSQFSYIQY